MTPEIVAFELYAAHKHPTQSSKRPNIAFLGPAKLYVQKFGKFSRRLPPTHRFTSAVSKTVEFRAG